MKITKVCLLAVLLLNAFMFGGCATVTRGTTETLMIQSQPSGADVRVSNGFTGRTPVTFVVPRKGDLIVTVSHPGHEPQEHVLRSELAKKGAAGVAGNALIGGVIGIGVDVATGAALSHKPNPLVVTLKPIEAVASAEGKTPHRAEKVDPVAPDVPRLEAAVASEPESAAIAERTQGTSGSSGGASAEAAAAKSPAN